MSLILRLTGNTVKAVGRTVKIENYIDRVTRFQPKGFEHSEKYEEGTWDGWIHLYDARNGTFPYGLLNDVIDMLCAEEVDFTIDDQRSFRSFDPLPAIRIPSLRDYQTEAMIKAIEVKRGVICLPTGSGKTRTAIAIIARLRLPALFFVHKKELLYQTKTALEQEFKTKIGQVGDGVVDLQPITVVMVQTASRLPQELFRDYGVAIFDECHHCPAESTLEIARELHCEYVIGLSVNGDTIVPIKTPEGEKLIRISDLVPDKSEGYTSLHNVETLSFNKAGKIHWTKLRGVHIHKNSKPLLKMRLKNGKEIHTTEHHSIFCLSPDGKIDCIPASRLKKGDYVVTPLKTPHTPSHKQYIDVIKVLLMSGINLKNFYAYGAHLPKASKIGNPKVRYDWRLRNHLPLNIIQKVGLLCDNPKELRIGKVSKIVSKIALEHISYLFGLFTADGWIDNRRIGFAIEQNPVKINKICDLITRSFGIKPTINKTKHKSVEIHVNSAVIAALFRALGFKNGARTKEIPSIIYSLNRKNLSHFMEGYIDGDGHITNKRNRDACYITTTSRHLCQGILHILSKFGEPAGIGLRQSISPQDGSLHGDVYSVYFSLFASKIVEREIGIKTHNYSEPKYRLIPIVDKLSKLLQMVEDRRGCHRTRLPRINKMQLLTGEHRRISRRTLEALIIRLKHQRTLSAEDEKILRILIATDLSFVEIKSITKTKTEKMVYDLSTQYGNFIGNGICCHNSATPRREDGKEMLIWAATGPICKNVSTSELIERKFLAKPYIDYIEVKAIPIGYHTKYQEVYKKAIVNNDERNGKIALKAVELAALGKTYIHVRQIAHGKTLTALINDALPDGYPKAEFIYGQDTSKTRQRVINSFRRKDLRIMVSTLLGEGMDLPEMYALILASGGLSRTFVQQVFGRVLRGSVHKVVEFWDVRDVCTYLYDHFLERVRFYKSEPAFVLSPKLEKIEVPSEKEK